MSETPLKPHSLAFGESDAEEVQSLLEDLGRADMPPFAMTRPTWLALANCALGKAQYIDAGRYLIPGEIPEDVRGEWSEWSAQLRSIAYKILDFFQPGDGNL